MRGACARATTELNIMRNRWILALAILVSTTAVACAASIATGTRWSAEEVDDIRSLWIGELADLNPDPTNRYADDSAAIALGHRLFFDTRLSSNGQVSCATCHLPDRQFQDDVPLARGVGTTNRRTMPVAGTAHSAWLFWDGRKDSQWSQALGPLESPVEHGGTRAQYAHVIAQHYRQAYEAIFGALPDVSAVPQVAGPVEDPAARAAWERLPEETRNDVTRVFVNIGKAIAAYERQLQPAPSRFDRYVETLKDNGRAPVGILSPEEEAGLRLFIGKANCTQCHNGPLLTDDHFHNTGIPAVASLPEDIGRATGAPQVLADEFNCRSRWSDAAPGECAELEFLAPDGHELVRAFKTPSLRGVADRAPYMHAGQVASLTDVIAHYNRAPKAPAGHSEVTPLRLNEKERLQLAAYLRSLDAPIAARPELLAPPR